MITLNFVAPSDRPEWPSSTIQCKTGQSLMQAAVSTNVVGIEADCGGLMTCGTCHVYLHEPHATQIPPPKNEELGMLDFTAAPRKANSRLSCQVMLTDEMDGLTVELPSCQH